MSQSVDELNSTNSGVSSWMDRIKESPRTVSALIIILIVAAAVYAFSGEEPATQDLADEGLITEEGAELAQQETNTEEAANDQVEATGTNEGAEATQRQEVSQAQLAQESQELPQASKNDQGYQEVAQAGDGITHLARRATTRWLSENQAGYTVTNEHRIFIEDYIQNRMGSQGLALGESMTVTYDMIAEAVTAAGQLNDGQLQNLSQYTYVLT